MRKIILNPQYKSLYTFIESLPQNFNAGGEIVQDRRNTIKKFKVNGLEINVKRYRVPDRLYFFPEIQSLPGLQQCFRSHQTGIRNP